MALVAVLGFLANWHHKTADRVARVDRDLSDFKVEAMRNFVGDADLSRLSQSIELLRGELNTVAADMRKELAEVAKGLNQLIGQAHSRG